MAENWGNPPEAVAPAAFGKKGEGNPLAFSLEFYSGAALVSLNQRKVVEHVWLERLAMEVPDVHFPFDVVGGAEQFRHHRCLLRELVLTIRQEDVSKAIGEFLDPARYGLEQVEVKLENGTGFMKGKFKVGDAGAPFTARLAFQPGADLSLQVAFYDLRVYGWLPMPSLAIVAQLARALKPMGAVQSGAAFVTLHPVRDLMRWLLPVHGWKIPELSGLLLQLHQVEHGKIRLVVGLPAQIGIASIPTAEVKPAQLERDALAFLAEAEAFRDAENALREGRLDVARQLYMGKTDLEPLYALSSRRLLDIGLTRPERFDELGDLIRDLLSRRPDFLPALMAQAVVEERLGLPAAGGSYERLGQLCFKASESEDAILAHQKAGQLLRSVDVLRAIDNYSSILRLHPDHQEAMAVLAELHLEAHQWHRALRMYLRLAHQLRDPQQLADCQARMGSIYLERFDDLDRARKYLETALMYQPENIVALRSLAIISQRREQPSRTASLLSKLVEIAEQTKDPSLLLETRLSLAQLWEEDLDDSTVAILQYEKILADHTEHLHSLFKVGSIAAQLQRWDKAVECLSRLLDLEAAGRALPEGVVKAACFILGQCYLALPEGAKEARSFLQRAADLDPKDLSAWMELERLDRNDKNWAHLVSVLEHKALLMDQPEAILATTLEAARLADRQLADQAKAEILYRRALQLNPPASEALESLGVILKEGKRWKELCELLEAGAQKTPEARKAAAHWFEVGQLRLDRLSDLVGGIEALQKALQLDPHHRAAQLRVLSYFRDQGRNADFVAQVDSMDWTGWEGPDRLRLCLEQARMLHEKLDRIPEAIAAYQQCLKLDSKLAQAHGALADLFFASAQWVEARQELLQVLALAGASGQNQVDLHRRLAAIEAAMGHRSAAIEQYRMVLSLMEDDVESSERMAELLREEGLWDELAAIYARRAELAKGESAAALHTAAAAIWWEKKHLLAPAAEQYQKAVEAASKSEAVPARLASLQRVYSELGQWQKVAEILRQRIAQAQAKDTSPMYMALAAILSSRLNQTSDAVVCWEQALEANADYLPAMLMLVRQRYDQSRYSEALELAKRAIHMQQSGFKLPAERIANIALDAARAAWRLQKHEEAIQMYNAHMEAFASRRYTGVDAEAFEHLEMLLREGRRFEELCLLYRRWLDSGAAPERRGGLQRAYGLLLFEHLDQPEEGIQILHQRVRQQPDDQPAVRDLLRMLRESGRWEQLVAVLEDQWQRAPLEKEQMARLEELAEIYQLRLDHPQKAIERLRQLVDLGHPSALKRLLGIYRQEGLNQNLVDLLQRQADQAEEPEEAAAILREISQVCREQLQDPRRALIALQSAHALVPSQTTRREATQLLRDQGDPEALRDYLSASLEEVEDSTEKRELLLELAELCLSRLDQRRDGIAFLRQALEIQAEETIARRVLAAYEEDQDYEGMADMQELLVDLASDPPTAARRMRRLGRIYLEQLQAPERARAAFEKAAELDPSWPEPLRDMGQVLSETGAWTALPDVWISLAALLPSSEEKSNLLQEAATISFEKLNDPRRGLDLFHQAAALAPEPTLVLQQLAKHQEQAGQFAQAADTLISTTDMTAPASKAMLQHLAHLREKAGQPDEALLMYERLSQLDPANPRAMAFLESHYRALSQNGRLAKLFEDAAVVLEAEKGCECWTQAARAWQEGGQPEKAEEALRRALAVAPLHQDTLQILIEQLGARGAWLELLEVLCNQPGEMGRQEQWDRVVNVAWEGVTRQPRDHEQDLAACRLMLRLRPNHQPALQRSVRLLEQLGKMDEAEAVLRKLDSMAQDLDPEQRYALDLRLASISFSRGRVEETEERLKRCIACKPDDPGPRAFLHKIYDGNQRFSDRVALLVDDAERASNSSERFAKLRDAAQMMEKELGDPRGAALLFEKILSADPDRLEAWRRLAELRRLMDEPAEQRRSLLQVARLCSGEEKLQARRRAAKLANEVLRDREIAFSDWSELLNEWPDDEEALDWLIEYERAEQRFDSLEKHLAKKVSATHDTIQLVSLLRERVDILVERLDRPAEAISLLETLQILQPAERDALERLDSLYERSGKWNELVQTLQQQMSLARSEEERVRLLMELAEVHSQRLDDPTSAVEALRQAASAAPRNPEPLGRLRTMALRTKDRRLLAEALDGLAACNNSSEQELQLRRAAALLHWAEGKKEDAKRGFSRVLVLNQNDVVARRFMVDLSLPAEPKEALGHLAGLTSRKEWLAPRLKSLLRTQLVELLSGMEPEEQIPVLEDLVQAAPEDRGAWEQLVEGFRKVGNQKALAGALACLATLEEPTQAAALWIERSELLSQQGSKTASAESFAKAMAIPGPHRHQVALKLSKLQKEDLGDPAAAIRSLEVAFEELPGDLSIMRRLLDGYQALGQLEKADHIIEMLLQQSGEKEQVTLLLQSAESRSQLGREKEAESLYFKVIEIDPACRLAFERLEPMLAKGDQAQLPTFYLQWAMGPAAGSQRARLFVNAARYFERKGDAEKAIAALEESLRVDSASAESYELLAPLLGRMQRWEDLLEVLYRRRELSSDPDRRLGIAFEMGEVCMEHLGDPLRAAVHFEYCLQIDPEHAGALEELADIRYQQQAPREAAELYQRLGDRGLSSKRFLVYFRRGEMAGALGDAEAAAGFYQQSIAFNQTFIPAWQHLAASLEMTQDWLGLLQTLQSLLEIVPEEGFEEVALEVRRQMGHTLRRLLRFEEAARWFHEVLQRNPNDVEAVRILKDFYMNRMNWEEAAIWARKELELEPLHPEAARRWITLGDLYHLKLSDHPQAEEAYRTAIEFAPDSMDVKWKLWTILRSRGAWEDLEVLGENLLKASLTPEQEGEVQRVMGRVRLLADDDREAALAHFERALALGAADLELADQVAQITRDLGKWARYASVAGQILEAKWAQGMDASAVVQGYIDLAEVYQLQLQDHKKSIACLRRSLEIKPQNVELIQRLAILYAANWDTCGDAIALFRELMHRDAADPTWCRYLARLEAARGNRDRSGWYYAGLKYLAPVDAEAKRYFDQSHPYQKARQPIARNEWDEVMLHPDADCLLQRIMAALAPFLELLFPADLDGYGVTGDDLADRHNYPFVVEAVEQARWLLSGRPLSVFVVEGMDTWQAGLESGGTPAVILPKLVVEKCTSAELMFYLAREVVLIAMGCVIPMKFSDQDLVQLLSILCRMARPEAEPPVALPPTASQYIEAIQKVTPADVMEMVIPLIRRYALESKQHDVGRWKQGIQRTADRFGLLVCADLNAALSVATRSSAAAEGRELAFIPDRSNLLRQDERMLELFRFAHSDGFHKVIKTLGLLPQDGASTPPSRG